MNDEKLIFLIINIAIATIIKDSRSLPSKPSCSDKTIETQQSVQKNPRASRQLLLYYGVRCHSTITYSVAFQPPGSDAVRVLLLSIHKKKLFTTELPTTKKNQKKSFSSAIKA